MLRFDISSSGYINKSCVTAYMSDQGYFYINLPMGSHGRTKRIWVSRRAIEIKNDNYVITDWLTFRKTEKGNIVLLPSDNKDETIVYVFAECGFRGYSEIEVENGEMIEKGEFYHSPRGALGVSEVALIKIRDGTKIIASRSGRLYGAPGTITAKFVFGPESIELIETEEESDEELKQLL